MRRRAFASALAYPRRYGEAIALRRRLRALPGALPFEQAFRVAQELGITQKPGEIRQLYELLREERPRHVLEIGLDQGGTLFLWSRVAADDAHLVSLDTRPLGPLGSAAPFAVGRRGVVRDSQRLDLLMPADSHDPNTLRRIETLLAGNPVDFLFVDGDHSYEGVRQDFELYSPLMRPGGLVAFHDISASPTPDTEGTSRFWREFAAGREAEELLEPGEPGFGIGLYRVAG